MEPIFTQLSEAISLGYILSVIIASYFIIRFADYISNDFNERTPKWLKRVLTFVIGLIVFAIFKMFTDTDTDKLITSYFVALFVYDSAIKFLIKKFNVDYK